METFTWNGIDFVSSPFTAITTAVTDNLAILLPVGLTIMGVMIGVSLIPRIIYKFL